ncbi:MAG: hypothetical protein GX610_22685 [Rhodococcus sp.]|nr:hypothetical protein [Rhodococcus sp. (in: high G+C Gram-positive bacteria)]
MIRPRLLPHTVTYKPMLGNGPYGPVFGDPVTARARVQFQRRMVRTAQATEVMSAATIYFRPGNTPGIGGMVTLPDGTEREVIVQSEHVGSREVELVSVDVG